MTHHTMNMTSRKRMADPQTSPMSAGTADDETIIVEKHLSRMWSADPGLVQHGMRTAHYSVALGGVLGLPQPDLWFLHVAGLLHDIGKMTLPQTLLQKDGPYTAQEYALVQCHPRAGAELLSGIPFL